jgi:hypothetical protein
MNAAMERNSLFWYMAGGEYATEPIVHGLVYDLLRSGGEEFLSWSPEDVEAATVSLVWLITAPAQVLTGASDVEVGGARDGIYRGSWDAYFIAMTMVIKALLPVPALGRPREILTRLRTFREAWERQISTGSSPQEKNDPLSREKY